MRGIYAAGVLDAFLLADFYPFDLYIGVSAGAMNLTSHLARQYQRNFRIITQIATRSEVVNVKRYLRGGHLLDLDALRELVRELEPFDEATARKTIANRQFVIVCTDVATGKAVYAEPPPAHWQRYAQASGTLPVIYRGFVDLEARLFIDGGVADPLPVLEAYRRGARRLVVVRTRPSLSVESRDLLGLRLAAALHRQHPPLKAALYEHYNRYFEALEFLDAPPTDVEVYQVTPSLHLRTGRLTRHRPTLEADYQLGVVNGEVALLTLQAVFKTDVMNAHAMKEE